jgi:hypothetical protein
MSIQVWNNKKLNQSYTSLEEDFSSNEKFGEYNFDLLMEECELSEVEKPYGVLFWKGDEKIEVSISQVFGWWLQNYELKISNLK